MTLLLHWTIIHSKCVQCPGTPYCFTMLYAMMILYVEMQQVCIHLNTLIHFFSPHILGIHHTSLTYTRHLPTLINLTISATRGKWRKSPINHVKLVISIVLWQSSVQCVSRGAVLWYIASDESWGQCRKKMALEKKWRRNKWDKKKWHVNKWRRNKWYGNKWHKKKWHKKLLT